MKAIKIHPKDKVAVAVEALNKGDIVTVDGKDILIKSPVPAGHKFALQDINSGENIIKYAYPIGHAKCDIEIGEHVHTDNVKSNLSSVLSYEYTPEFSELERVEPACFMGYRRKDGKVELQISAPCDGYVRYGDTLLAQGKSTFMI